MKWTVFKSEFSDGMWSEMALQFETEASYGYLSGDELQRFGSLFSEGEFMLVGDDNPRVERFVLTSEKVYRKAEAPVEDAVPA